MRLSGWLEALRRGLERRDRWWLQGSFKKRREAWNEPSIDRA